MTRFHRWSFTIAAPLFLFAAPAEAQYWAGALMGGQTAQGSIAQGMGVYAAGAGQYNQRTAVANAIDANTALQFNEYVYQSRIESGRIYHAQLARDASRSAKNAEALRVRLRDNPNEVDISRGDALNVALDELSNPKVFERSLYEASKKKVGGEAIRDIPFQYASAAISVSVHQLTQGGAPPALRDNEIFATDRAALRAIAAELRAEGDATGTLKPETIRKAKDQILATKAKIEATFARGSADRVAADKFIKALYGFAKMLETPAVNVLLAGVEKHPDATLADLLRFMANFNLRFGAAQTNRQKEVYRELYPLLVQVRDGVVVAPGSNADAGTPIVGHDAPLAAFDKMSFDQIDGKAPPAPAPREPR